MNRPTDATEGRAPDLMTRTDTDDYLSLFLQNIPLLDVRAPTEFGCGGFPAATNIPLLDDDERHLVGLRYHQDGQDDAIQLGQQLVSGDVRDSRLKQWVTFVHANPQGFLYCFRGGLRSRTTQEWLKENGIEYPLVLGGYKAMRRFLLDELNRLVPAMPLVVLGGRTGSGKTLLLKQLQHHVDLEELAHHRGSSFGSLAEPQPSNIDFENALSIALLRHWHTHSECVFLEDESRMIGKVGLPDVLNKRMSQLPVVILETPLPERVEVSLQAYIVDLLAIYARRLGNDAGLTALATHHRDSLARIRKRFGGVNYAATLKLFDEAVSMHRSRGDLDGYRPYISKLLADYYDPMYDYQISVKNRPILFTGGMQEIIDWTASTNVVCEL